MGDKPATMPKKRGGGGGGGGDKRESFFAALRSQKLDTIRYSLSHGGVPITAEDEEGHRCLEICATYGKDKALDQILQILDRQRGLREYLDMVDEDGRTALMMACHKGQLACVQVLCKYNASLTKKCNKGKTASDYANAGGKQSVIDYLAPESSDEDDGAEAEDDGLTAGERRRAKKKALDEASFSNVIKKTGEVTLEEAHAAKIEAEEVAQVAKDKMQAGAQWEELKSLQHMEGRDTKELTLVKEKAEDAVAGAEGGVDPAMWNCVFLNRLSLKMPAGVLTSLSPMVAQLNALDILILTGNSLQSLPDSIGEISTLRVLEVDQNALACLPASIGQLEKLEVLNLGSNQIESLEPIAEANWPNLLTLNLDTNNIKDLVLPFASMARIQTLSIAHNQLETISETMGVLGETGTLMSLSVAHNNLTDISSLRDLKDKKLKSLNVEENPIADKKVLKLLNGSRPEQIIKELLKYLQKQGGGGGGKKGKKKK